MTTPEITPGMYINDTLSNLEGVLKTKDLVTEIFSYYSLYAYEGIELSNSDKIMISELHVCIQEYINAIAQYNLLSEC